MAGLYRKNGLRLEDLFSVKIDGIEDEMTIQEMREYLSGAIKRIGNPDSLSMLVELAQKIEDQDDADPDDFEYIGKEEL